MRSAPWPIVVVTFVAVASGDFSAQREQVAAQVQQPLQSVLDLQRTYDTARSRRAPVTHLLADAFVEIQADGRVLTRADAIEKYTRYDDISGGFLDERRTGSYGDIVIIAGRAGEEGTPYSARRLSVWARERGSWKLLAFQKTFMRKRTAQLSPFSSKWPEGFRNELSGLTEEQTFATLDPALLRGLLADDLMLVDGYGEQFTAGSWLAQLSDSRHAVPNVRSRRVLHEGEAVVIIGDDVLPASSLSSRFTRVWARSIRGWQLHVSQTTLAAAEVFGANR